MSNPKLSEVIQILAQAVTARGDIEFTDLKFTRKDTGGFHLEVVQAASVGLVDVKIGFTKPQESHEKS